MCSYVFMKLLESTPERYDRGMRILFGGRIERVYREIAERVAAPQVRILDIGCGTGGVSLACAARGAQVVGIDANAGMLEVARARQAVAPGHASVEWLELGAAEVEDRFPPRTFDAVVSCLAFSEMFPEEQFYVLRAVHTRLKNGGALVVADEVRPGTRAGRLRRGLRRAPAAAITWLLTQTTTRPVDHLGDRVRAAGFVRVMEKQLAPGDFAIVEGWKEEPA
jgi:2-polyprenyl-3-methyl-5-hydroxy-6-metoxy-1,4-benzoquinol methylase